MSIKNIHRNFNNTDTPTNIYRMVDGELKKIKRVYKVVDDNPVIVWDLGDDLIIEYTIENTGWYINYPLLFEDAEYSIPITGTIDWGDGTSEPYVVKKNGDYYVNISHYYQTAGKYTTTLKFDEPAEGLYTYRSAFGDMTITGVSIPTSVKDISGEMFASCYATDINFGGVERIPYECCHGCTKLKTVVLSKNCTYIGTNAFAGCYSLEVIDIPDSVETIDQFAFLADDSYKNFKEINFGENSKLSMIYNNPFQYTHIETISFPKDHKIVFDTQNGQSILFCYCKQLKVADLGGLENFYKNTFLGCSALTDVYINNGITSMDMYSSMNGTGSSATVNLHYRGTLAEWSNVQKLSSLNVGQLTVICTDGSVVYKLGDYWKDGTGLDPAYNIYD